MKHISHAIIIKEGRLLLIKRSDYSEVFPHQWACPGGRGEKNESPEESVVREVKEEINLEFKPTKLFVKSRFRNRDFYQFLGEWKGQAKVESNEIEDWDWFSHDEMLELKLGFNYPKTVKKLYQEELIR